MPEVNDELVLFKTFYNSHEVNIVKSFLETKGIETIIFDEHANKLYATSAIAIRLMIKSSLVEKAKEELKNQKQFLFEVHLDLNGPPCPQCQSNRTEIIPNKKNNVTGIIIAVLLFVPLAKHEVNWTCYSCKHKWVDIENTPILNKVANIIRLLVIIGFLTLFYTIFADSF